MNATRKALTVLTIAAAAALTPTTAHATSTWENVQTTSTWERVGATGTWEKVRATGTWERVGSTGTWEKASIALPAELLPATDPASWVPYGSAVLPPARPGIA